MDQRPFTPPQIAGVVAMAVVAGCIPSLQPILLGALLTTGRLTAAQIGQAAMVEGLGMAIGAALASAFFKPSNLRLVAVGGVLVMAAANAASIVASAGGIIAARGANGFAGGVLLWILIGLLTRAKAPARLFAIYVTIQAALAFLLSSLYSSWLVPSFGVAGSYGVLSALSLALLLAVMVIPPAYDPLPSAGNTRAPTANGWVGLLAVFTYLAGILVLWVYFVPLGRELGRSDATVGLAISAAIGVQILGGLAATVLASKVGGVQANLAGCIGAGAAILLLLYGGSDITFYLAAAVFCFFWMFVPPFHMPLLMGFDPTHRSAMFISSAQLIGVSAGPLFGSIVVTPDHFTGAALAGLGLFAASAVLTLLGAVAARRLAPAAAAHPSP